MPRTPYGLVVAAADELPSAAAAAATAVAAAVGAVGVTICTSSESGGRRGTDDIVEGEKFRTKNNRERKVEEEGGREK